MRSMRTNGASKNRDYPGQNGLIYRLRRNRCYFWYLWYVFRYTYGMYTYGMYTWISLIGWHHKTSSMYELGRQIFLPNHKVQFLWFILYKKQILFDKGNLLFWWYCKYFLSKIVECIKFNIQIGIQFLNQRLVSSTYRKQQTWKFFFLIYNWL